MAIAQRSAATGAGALWVPELSAAQVGVIVRLFFLTTVPVLAVILLLVDGLRESGDRPSVSANIRDALRDPGVAALASLALMPVTLIVVSVVLQPSMLDRYAIVTVLAWPPFVAPDLRQLITQITRPTTTRSRRGRPSPTKLK